MIFCQHLDATRAATTHLRENLNASLMRWQGKFYPSKPVAVPEAALPPRNNPQAVPAAEPSPPSPHCHQNHTTPPTVRKIQRMHPTEPMPS